MRDLMVPSRSAFAGAGEPVWAPSVRAKANQSGTWPNTRRNTRPMAVARAGWPLSNLPTAYIETLEEKIVMASVQGCVTVSACRPWSQAGTRRCDATAG